MSFPPLEVWWYVGVLIPTMASLGLFFFLYFRMKKNAQETETVIKKIIKSTDGAQHWNAVGQSYQRDVEFLMTLINNYTQREFSIKKFYRENKFGLGKPALFKDQDLAELTRSVAESVWLLLGEDYKKLLRMYHGDDIGIQTFIVNEIHQRVFESASKHNAASVRAAFKRGGNSWKELVTAHTDGETKEKTEATLQEVQANTRPGPGRPTFRQKDIDR